MLQCNHAPLQPCFHRVLPSHGLWLEELLLLKGKSSTQRWEERQHHPREEKIKHHHPKGARTGQHHHPTEKGGKSSTNPKVEGGRQQHPKEGEQGNITTQKRRRKEAKHHNPEGERRDKHSEGVGEGSTTPKKDRKAPPSKQRIGTEHRQGAGGGTTFTFTLLNCVGLGVSCRRSAFSSCPCCCLFFGSFSSCRHAPLKNDQFSSATKVKNEQFQHHWCCVVCMCGFSFFASFRCVVLCCDVVSFFVSFRLCCVVL